MQPDNLKSIPALGENFNIIYYDYPPYGSNDVHVERKDTSIDFPPFLKEARGLIYKLIGRIGTGDNDGKTIWYTLHKRILPKGHAREIKKLIKQIKLIQEEMAIAEDSDKNFKIKPYFDRMDPLFDRLDEIYKEFY